MDKNGLGKHVVGTIEVTEQQATILFSDAYEGWRKINKGISEMQAALCEFDFATQTKNYVNEEQHKRKREKIHKNIMNALDERAAIEGYILQLADLIPSSEEMEAYNEMIREQAAAELADEHDVKE